MCELTDQERLAAYDRLYEDLLKERDQVLARMAVLRTEGKERTEHAASGNDTVLSPDIWLTRQYICVKILWIV